MEAAGDNESSARRLWLLSLLYVVVSLVLAVVITSGQIGPAETLGLDAYQTLNSIPNADIPRNWYDHAKSEAYEYLVQQVELIEQAHPGTIEISHQEVPISGNASDLWPNTSRVPFQEPDCLSIVLEDQQECIDDWPYFEDSRTCATSCPFDITAPEGPRCCGELGLDGGSPMIPFARPLWAGGVSKNGTLQNVIFAVKARNSTIVGDQMANENETAQAIFASAHYDSNQGAPGIGDDLAGVAVLLECARALAARETPLRRDVIFALIDGEESGLLGATAFRAGHPWREWPAAVVNLEGKGKANKKSWMLRSNSEYMARIYAQQTRRASGNSLSEFIWATLNPGSTDLDIYRRMGYHMMDILFIQDAFVYHTYDDNIEKSASAEALQHEGGTVLSILEYLASEYSLPKLLDSSDDPMVGVWNNQYGSDPGFSSGYVYFAILDAWMVAMPIFSAQMFFGAIAVLVPVVTLPAVRGRVGAALADCGKCLLCMVLGIASAYLHSRYILVYRDLRAWYDWQVVRFLFLGFAGALPTLLLQGWRKPADEGDTNTLLVGPVWLYCLLLLALGIALPHAGSSFMWFPLFAAVALSSSTAAARTGPGDSETELSTFQPSASDDAVPAASGTSKETLSQRVPLWNGVKVIPFGLLAMRDAVAVLLPSLLAIPMAYNLVNTLSYILDGIGYSYLNGVLCGFFGSLLAMPFVSVHQHLSSEGMRTRRILELAVYVLLLAAVLLVPVDESARCHFNRLNCEFFQTDRSTGER